MPSARARMSKSFLRVRPLIEGNARQFQDHGHKGCVGPIGIGAAAANGTGPDQQIQVTQQLQLTGYMGLRHAQHTDKFLDRPRASDGQAKDAEAGGCAQPPKQPGNRLSTGNQKISDRSCHSPWESLNTIRTPACPLQLWVDVPIARLLPAQHQPQLWVKTERR
jgi:hypothetical protein